MFYSGVFPAYFVIKISHTLLDASEHPAFFKRLFDLGFDAVPNNNIARLLNFMGKCEVGLHETGRELRITITSKANQNSMSTYWRLSVQMGHARSALLFMREQSRQVSMKLLVPTTPCIRSDSAKKVVIFFHKIPNTGMIQQRAIPQTLVPLRVGRFLQEGANIPNSLNEAAERVESLATVGQHASTFSSFSYCLCYFRMRIR